MEPAVSWEHLTDVERTCLGVAFTRWHASSNGTLPCTWPDGSPWYRDPLGPLFVAGIPKDKQEELEEVRLKGDSWMRLFCAVRTAEIDARIQEALQESGVKQMVLIGSGMDTRAWRLQWLPGFVVFEIDTQQVHDFKHRMLTSHNSSAAASGASEHQEQQQGQQEGQGSNGSLPKLSCEKRVAIRADASNAQGVWAKLLEAGFSADTPTLYVLEGFIGYLERQAGDRLLALLAANSAPNSRIIMTVPPSPAERDRRSAAADEAAAEAAAAASADGAAAAGEVTQGADGVYQYPDGTRVYRPKLHHATFEEPEETLARLAAAGWSDTQMLSNEELSAKYGVPRAQPILLGRKAQ